MSFGSQFYRTRFEPVPEEIMKKTNRPGTICGVLREIWQKSDNPEVKELARLATAMAKRMGKKLNEYHAKYSIG